MSLLQALCPHCNQPITRNNLINLTIARCPNRRCRMEVYFEHAQIHGRNTLEKEKSDRRERKLAEERALHKERAEEKARREFHSKQRQVVSVLHQGQKLYCRANQKYHQYQKDGIAKLVTRQFHLLADEMGLGKTIQAIGLINSLDLNNVLIVCPASLKLNWQKELIEWLTRFENRKISVVNATNPQLGGTILIVNYDILHRFVDALSQREWDLIVGDEAHRIKSPQALRTKAFLKLKSPRRLLLTGTPVLNRPDELWPLLHWLDPSEWPNLNQFLMRYCVAPRTSTGKYITLDTARDDLHKKLKPVMLRRLKKDVLHELPAKYRQIICLPSDDDDLLKAELDLFIKLRAESVRLQQAVERAKLLKNDHELKIALQQLREWRIARLGHISRVRHNTAMLKVPYVVEHLNDIVDQSGKAICFIHHRDVGEKIIRSFNGRSVLFYGGMSQNAKDDAVNQFQQDPGTSLFVGSISAAGQGITLTASSTVVFAELDWTPANLSQCEDRAHRIGQKDHVLVQHLVIDGSIDSLMARKIVDKQWVIDAVVDGKGSETSQIDVDDLVSSYLDKANKGAK